MNTQELIAQIIRDVAELDNAPMDDSNAMAVTVDELQVILERNLATLTATQPKGDEPCHHRLHYEPETGAFCDKCGVAMEIPPKADERGSAEPDGWKFKNKSGAWTVSGPGCKARGEPDSIPLFARHPDSAQARDAALEHAACVVEELREDYHLSAALRALKGVAA